MPRNRTPSFILEPPLRTKPADERACGIMTETRPEAQEYSITNVFSRPGETGTSQDIIDLLPARSA